MPTRITDLSVFDIRFPTSRSRAGSDAINTDPDYSLAYAILHTDSVRGLEGHGFTFTIGRGNELCVEGIRAFRSTVVGRTLEDLTADMRAFSAALTQDSQLRWLGPEKGVIHLSAAAVINAVWDLYAKSVGKPLWKLLVDLSPEQLVAALDFRYITDLLTPDEALEILERQQGSRAEREREMRANGYPAYTTSVGWYGYSDREIKERLGAALAEGWTHFKVKVGGRLEDDLRRVALVREAIGPDRKLMLDANQVWDVDTAVAHINRFASFDPWWMEEPTSPDDVLGYATIARRVEPVRLAAGEHAQNRVIFKQLLQSHAIAFCQVDACRLAGVNEVLAVLLMAAKCGVPVCPHAGGVGLPEYVQHVALFDYMAVSASLTDRTLEYVDHLHEHFQDPVIIRDGRYRVPTKPGYSAALCPRSVRTYQYPDGSAWTAR
jgi:L-fuconate dehydratase